MTLTDAGALVALVDKNQPQNARCRATFAVLSLPLITTWPAFTEAIAEKERMRQLMEQYRDTPMDLADASLVATTPINRAFGQRGSPSLADAL